jgi:hypothetical protein
METLAVVQVQGEFRERSLPLEIGTEQAGQDRVANRSRLIRDVAGKTFGHIGNVRLYSLNPTRKEASNEHLRLCRHGRGEDTTLATLVVGLNGEHHD